MARNTTAAGLAPGLIPNGGAGASRPAPLAPGDRFMTQEEVCVILGIGRTWFADRVRSGEAPAPVKLGHSSRWVESEIRAFAASLVAQRPNQSVAA